MSQGLFEFVGKIGNYAIPAFGAFLTLALAAGSWDDTRSLRLVSGFAVFSLLSAFVAYWHRLAWLRQHNRQSRNGQTPSDLSTGMTALFLILHLGLILSLIWFVYDFVWTLSGAEQSVTPPATAEHRNQEPRRPLAYAECRWRQSA
jgi:H+/Cl- antiporter ClcA